MYEYILLDCPADISLITYAALCASDFLLVPLEAAQWGTLGTQHIVTTLRHVQKHHNGRLKLPGFVASRFERGRTYQQQYLKELRQHFGDDAFNTVIPHLAPFEQSVNDRMPIVLHSPSSHTEAIARTDPASRLTKRHLDNISKLKPADQHKLATRIQEEQLNALETEQLVEPQSPNRCTSKRSTKQSDLAARQHRFHTRKANVVMTFRRRDPLDCDFCEVLRGLIQQFSVES